MSDGMSALAANSAASWEAMRGAALDGPPRVVPEWLRHEPCPGYSHRVEALLAAVAWCWGQLADARPAVLDVAAGSGAVGMVGAELVRKGVLAPFHYAATEQSAALCGLLKRTVPEGSVAQWRFGPAPDGQPSRAPVSLAQALGEAQDAFLRAYPVVVLSHVLEHVGDPYALLDEAWSVVRPGGFLVVCVPRNDEHRTHTGTWEWNRLLGVLRQYAPLGQPMAVWEDGYWSDLLCVVPKGAPDGAPDQGTAVAGATPAVATQVGGSRGAAHGAAAIPAEAANWTAAEGVQVVAHVDQRIRGGQAYDDYLTKKAI